MEGYGRVDREDSLDCGESLVSREWGLQDGEWTHGELGFGVGQAGGERGELQERGLGRVQSVDWEDVDRRGPGWTPGWTGGWTVEGGWIIGSMQ